MPSMDRTPAQVERLGELWRSQGEAFLEQHAQDLQGDINRLRDVYVSAAESRAAASARPRRPARSTVIDLRPPSVEGMACSTHGDAVAVDRCHRCGNAFCALCLLQSAATHDQPLCTECALTVSGVHHKRLRPLVAPGRPGRTTR